MQIFTFYEPIFGRLFGKSRFLKSFFRKCWLFWFKIHFLEFHVFENKVCFQKIHFFIAIVFYDKYQFCNFFQKYPVFQKKNRIFWLWCKKYNNFENCLKSRIEFWIRISDRYYLKCSFLAWKHSFLNKNIDFSLI